ncbi:MAG: hypothetical protein AB2L24_29380 [Mangrovibacterium sp.]
MKTQKKEPTPRSAPNKGYVSDGKCTTNQRITKEKADKCCLWFSPDTYEPYMDSVNNMPSERANLGGYVPSITGSREQIKSLIKRLKKKPCLVEKYIKILD